MAATPTARCPRCASASSFRVACAIRGTRRSRASVLSESWATVPRRRPRESPGHSNDSNSSHGQTPSREVASRVVDARKLSPPETTSHWRCVRSEDGVRECKKQSARDACAYGLRKRRSLSARKSARIHVVRLVRVHHSGQATAGATASSPVTPGATLPRGRSRSWYRGWRPSFPRLCALSPGRCSPRRGRGARRGTRRREAGLTRTACCPRTRHVPCTRRAARKHNDAPRVERCTEGLRHCC